MSMVKGEHGGLINPPDRNSESGRAQARHETERISTPTKSEQPSGGMVQGEHGGWINSPYKSK